MTMVTALSQRLRQRVMRIAAAVALTLRGRLSGLRGRHRRARRTAHRGNRHSDDRITAAQKLDADKLFGAIVKVSTRSIPDARSAETLGNEREGTGVVIGDNGLVLTIGYLIVEADDVKVTDAKGRTLPARIVGYDHASGFGLVRTRRAARRAADAARRFGQDRGTRSGDDRERRRRRHVVRVDRVQAPVHRQLGVSARLRALHEPAHVRTGAARR